MEEPLLRDEREYPSDDVLARYLGNAKPAWDALTTRLTEDFLEVSLEWRYYKDGNSWLGKLVRKKKTVCWVSILDEGFQTTFYFTAKNDLDIDQLPIAQTFIGKLKPITVRARKVKELGNIVTLLSTGSNRGDTGHEVFLGLRPTSGEEA